MKSKNIIFLDGHWLKVNESFIESLSPGLVMGDGVFETMAAFDGKVLFWEEHWLRLRDGLKSFSLRPPCPRKRISQYITDALHRNHLKNARVRLAVWKEDDRVRMAILVGPLAPGSRKGNTPWRAHISRINRSRSERSRIKSLDYGCFRQAFLEARAEGFDEALLLNDQGQLVEGSRTNIFYVKDNVLYTPDTACGCLDGITRKLVLKCARQSKMACATVQTDWRDLLKADEVFLTNAVFGLRPLIQVNDVKIGRPDSARPVTDQLSRLYRQMTADYLRKRQ